MREIGQAVGLSSSSTVHAHLTALEKKGFLKRDPSKPRALVLLKDKKQVAAADEQVLNIPLLGRVAAGQPVLAVQEWEEKIPLPASYFNPNCFAVKVKGDSMIKAGIFAGDIVIVQPQPVAQAGEIVVALLDDEVTIKYFYPEKNQVRLEPANDAYKPIFVQDLRILGKVVGLLRPRFS